MSSTKYRMSLRTEILPPSGIASRAFAPRFRRAISSCAGSDRTALCVLALTTSKAMRGPTVCFNKSRTPASILPTGALRFSRTAFRSASTPLREGRPLWQSGHFGAWRPAEPRPIGSARPRGRPGHGRGERNPLDAECPSRRQGMSPPARKSANSVNETGWQSYHFGAKHRGERRATIAEISDHPRHPACDKFRRLARLEKGFQ